ncbi:hypothetical protein KWI13_24740, partial [Enterobacter cloacae]|nr:hypothetical protein [Enterobacter cloacae]
RVAQDAEDRAVGKFRAVYTAETANRSEFDGAVARSWGKENIKAIKLTCNGNPAYLTEMQVSLKADTINNPLSAASFAPRPPPGTCGTQFVIDKAGSPSAPRPPPPPPPPP